MKTGLFKVFFLVLLFTSCKGKDVPDDLIPKDKMVDLVSETHVLEALVGRLSLDSYDSASVAFQYLQEELWKKHEVDSGQYNRSYEYYSKYPKLFSEIYQQVEDRLEEMENEEKGIETAEPLSIEK